MKAFSLLPFAQLAAFGLTSVNGATLLSADFSSEGLNDLRDIDVTGPDIVAWGYFVIDNEFTPGVVDNRKGDFDIGSVAVIPGDVARATFMWSDALPKYTLTFVDGEDPGAGTVGIGTGFGAWAPTEDNAATLVFNDLGRGIHTVRVFAGHSSNDRIFNMDFTATAADGNLAGNRESSPITSGDLHTTFEVVFSTTDPEADLTLQLNSTSGGTGSGWLGGYVVETSGRATEPTLSARTITDPVGKPALEVTLTGTPDVTYLFTSSATLDFSNSTPVLNLTQADPDNDPGTIAGPDQQEITTDGEGRARLRLTIPAGIPVNFIRAEELLSEG